MIEIPIEMYAHNLVVFLSIEDFNDGYRQVVQDHFEQYENGSTPIYTIAQNLKDSVHRMILDQQRHGCKTQYQNMITITMSRFDERNEVDYSTLMHEILHAVFGILDFAGLKYSGKSEEAYTYLMGYITKKVFRGIIDRREEVQRKDEESRPVEIATKTED